MKRPTKAEIKAAVEKLKQPTETSGEIKDQPTGKLGEKKSSQRIRKQGV